MPAIIVFSRMDSRRLPGKALADLCGRPMLGRVLDRIRRAAQCRQIIVATSDRQTDDPIAAFADSEGVGVFRGHDTDVAGRALDCCDAFGVDAFVRVSGDSPFMPPELVDRALETARDSGGDIATNVFPRSYPAGASVEVIRVDALRRAHMNMTPDEREHVTTHFYRTADNWRIVNFVATDPDYAGVRLTVDTAAELAAARQLVERLMPSPETASLPDVVALRRALQPAA